MMPRYTVKVQVEYAVTEEEIASFEAEDEEDAEAQAEDYFQRMSDVVSATALEVTQEEDEEEEEEA